MWYKSVTYLSYILINFKSVVLENSYIISISALLTLNVLLSEHVNKNAVAGTLYSDKYITAKNGGSLGNSCTTRRSIMNGCLITLNRESGFFEIALQTKSKSVKR